MIFEVMQDRQESWQRGLEQGRRITDPSGRPIDAGILETVVVLNLLSVQTTASCQGHLEAGGAYPWVNLSKPPETWDEQERRCDELEKAFMSHCEIGTNGLSFKDDEAGRLYAEREAIANEIRIKQRSMIMRLLPYLEEFYTNHHCSYDRRLTFDEQGLFREGLRLQSIGATFQEARPEEQRRQKLLEYQEEMRTFTEFLKTRFFQQ